MAKNFASGALNINMTVKVGRFRGANGMAHLGLMMDNEHERVLAKARRTVRKAAFFARTSMRRPMRRGRTKRIKQNVRSLNKSGQWITKRSSRAIRTRSKPGTPPNYHAKGGGFGLKWIWAQPLGGNLYAWEIGPEFRKTKGSNSVSFKIDKMLEKGGSGRVMMAVNPNQPIMNTNQHFKNPLQKAQMHWVSARYPARPYASPALLPTLRQFKTIWGKSFG
jgi:hypothetical protein